MELEFEQGGLKIPIEESQTQIGRELLLGLGFGPDSVDRTLSRRHLSLRPIEDPAEKLRIEFEVIGMNPVWVYSEGVRRTYRSGEKGELRAGDKFSLSLKNPAYWTVKRKEGENAEEEEETRGVLGAVERREKRTKERREREERVKEKVFEGEDDDEEVGSVDVSQIDPVKEFGFLVKGHEFDQYLKKQILRVKEWNWFLEEPSEKSDSDETIDGGASSRRKKGKVRSKKGGVDDEDEEWTGESEEEQAVVKGGSTKRPKYSTRLKDKKKARNEVINVRNPSLRKASEVRNDEDDEEDEEDETLGGFIVDEEEEEEEEVEEDEESEEDFDDEMEDEE